MDNMLRFIKKNKRYLRWLYHFIDYRLPYLSRYLHRKLLGSSRILYGPPVTSSRRVLIITTEQNYNGGSLVADYAADALVARGFGVLLCAPAFDPALRDELIARKLSLCEYPAQMYAKSSELEWAREFDFAIVNVFQSAPMAVAVSRIIPTIWWIHEPSDSATGIYSYIRKRFRGSTTLEALRPVNTYAVSNIARRAFEEFYPGYILGILPFGIPDERSAYPRRFVDVVTIALIGGVEPHKAQLAFAEAYAAVKTPFTRALLIGSYDESAPYTKKVLSRASEIDSLELTGELTRKELGRVFADIDIVVCPSTEETVSIAVIEGLMNGKLCIMSDNVGVADVIEDGVNGFICRTGDVDSLAYKLDYAIKHFKELDDMRARARVTYEEHFSMERFSDRLEALVDEYTAACKRPM